MIEFVKLSPTENMTVLVRTEHSVEEYRDIALRLMSYGSVHAEQVGFIRQPTSTAADAGLHMAAGEFCGNACMALAALVASERRLPVDQSVDVTLEASGAAGPVRCRVVRGRLDYSCRLTMPIPRTVRGSATIGEVGRADALVVYDNCTHAVVEVERIDPAAREAAQALAARLGEMANAPLVGVMVYDPGSNHLAPLVHIPALGGMTWERGCGSGAGSLGAYLAWKRGSDVATSVVQPGGTMNVRASYGSGGLSEIAVEGSVRIVAEGKAYI
ncbi:diaminopimelate epimerase [Plantactinospora sp. KBS50]|uniref:diaminopimelate epimerase n=1 Tax=Plantactinospora sp. KBS50 TaxID=2024580 RepID=UPI0012FD5337|nr:diaminopimelate epimerase [Plantactinospora sp. KBS50]